MKVKDLQNREDLLCVSCDVEVKTIKEYLGEKAKEFDSSFVKIEDGEYREVYGMHGSVPHLDKDVEKLI